MHMLPNIGTNGGVEQLHHILRWGRNANGLYYKHKCIMYLCIYMQGWLHDGEHLHVCNYNLELQQGHVHHNQIKLKSYMIATIVEY